MPQPLVLAIEPDLRQAAIVKRIVREKVLADVVVVDSPDAALEAIRRTVPDVLLISALLSPRDEDELIAHLRTLEGADHLETHTIPQLASALGPNEGRASRGLLSVFRRKKKEPDDAPSGCDPDIFAEEIRSYLQRAAEQKREYLEALKHAGPHDNGWRTATRTDTDKVAEPAAPSAEAESTTSSWASPFEWKPSNPSALISNPYSRAVNREPANPSSLIPDPESLIAHPESPIAHPESPIAHLESLIAHPESPIAHPESPIARPESLIAHPESPIAHPESPIAHPESPTASPESEMAEPVMMAVAEEPVISVQSAEPVQASAPIAAPIQDAGLAIRDSRLGIRDQRSGIRDNRLGSLAGWMRTERAPVSASARADDLRALLCSLAVPTAVAAVGYPRGVRIRRVRVPAAREPQLTEPAGAVILSKHLLAEQQERREPPRA